LPQQHCKADTVLCGGCKLSHSSIAKQTLCSVEAASSPTAALQSRHCALWRLQALPQQHCKADTVLCGGCKLSHSSIAKQTLCSVEAASSPTAALQSRHCALWRLQALPQQHCKADTVLCGGCKLSHSSIAKQTLCSVEAASSPTAALQSRHCALWRLQALPQQHCKADTVLCGGCKLSHSSIAKQTLCSVEAASSPTAALQSRHCALWRLQALPQQHCKADTVLCGGCKLSHSSIAKQTLCSVEAASSPTAALQSRHCALWRLQALPQQHCKADTVLCGGCKLSHSSIAKQTLCSVEAASSPTAALQSRHCALWRLQALPQQHCKADTVLCGGCKLSHSSIAKQTLCSVEAASSPTAALQSRHCALWRLQALPQQHCKADTVLCGGCKLSHSSIAKQTLCSVEAASSPTAALQSRHCALWRLQALPQQHCKADTVLCGGCKLSHSSIAKQTLCSVEAASSPTAALQSRHCALWRLQALPQQHCKADTVLCGGCKLSHSSIAKQTLCSVEAASSPTAALQSRHCALWRLQALPQQHCKADTVLCGGCKLSHSSIAKQTLCSVEAASSPTAALQSRHCALWRLQALPQQHCKADTVLCGGCKLSHSSIAKQTLCSVEAASSPTAALQSRHCALWRLQALPQQHCKADTVLCGGCKLSHSSIAKQTLCSVEAASSPTAALQSRHCALWRLQALPQQHCKADTVLCGGCKLSHSSIAKQTLCSVEAASSPTAALQSRHCALWRLQALPQQHCKADTVLCGGCKLSHSSIAKQTLCSVEAASSPTAALQSRHCALWRLQALPQQHCKADTVLCGGCKLSHSSIAKQTLCSVEAASSPTAALQSRHCALWRLQALPQQHCKADTVLCGGCKLSHSSIAKQTLCSVEAASSPTAALQSRHCALWRLQALPQQHCKADTVLCGGCKLSHSSIAKQTLCSVEAASSPTAALQSRHCALWRLQALPQQHCKADTVLCGGCKLSHSSIAKQTLCSVEAASSPTAALQSRHCALWRLQALPQQHCKADTVLCGGCKLSHSSIAKQTLCSVEAASSPTAALQSRHCALWRLQALPQQHCKADTVSKHSSSL
ncbi:UNVERIFIED_CONTAM: hypothetical protein FKN15_042623, partial [Acipenser sinensis]